MGGKIRIELPGSFPFRTEIPVRITDLNYGGHVGNDRVLGLLHEARVRFLASMGYSEQDVEGAGIIMAGSAIRYVSEIHYPATLRAEVAAGNFTASGCDILYRLADAVNGKERVRARTAIVFYNYTLKKVCRMPEKFRERIIRQNTEI